MFVLVTIFNNDETAHPPTLLKTESTTDTLIGQVGKFQNSCFKEHLWKVVAAQTKSVYFKSVPWNMLAEALNVTIFISSFIILSS